MNLNKYKRRALGLVFVGISLILFGIYMFLREEPLIVLSKKFFQPVVLNGALELILGFGFIGGGISTYINREKLMRADKEKLRLERKERKRGFTHL